MRDPNLLRRLLARCTRNQDQRPSPGLAPGRLRFFLLAGLIGSLLGGGGPSCVVLDPAYCTTRDQCPMIETDLGTTQLLCHPTRHVCLESAGPDGCLLDEDCRDFRNPRCDTDTNLCTSCRAEDMTDTSCAHLGDRKLCVNATDGSNTTLCVACRTSDDCPMTAPICDAQQCRRCASHRDCEGSLNCDNGAPCIDSLVCIQEGDLTPELAGRCAQNGPGSGGRVVYVSNNTTAACSEANTGSDFSVPVCSLDTALDKAVTTQGRHFIRVVGAIVSPLNSKPISAGSYLFIGAPAKDYVDAATVQGRGTFFTVNGTGALTLDQLNLVETNTGAGTTIVTCQQSAIIPPSLTIRGSVITGSVWPNLPNPITPAIFVSSCNTLIDGNIIGVSKTTDLEISAENRHATAISIVDNNRLTGTTSYLIQNNIIAGNAGAAIDLSGSRSATPRFVLRFNTIVGNGQSTPDTASAIICPYGKDILQEFSHSIVVGNSMAVGSQFSQPEGCSLKDVVVDPREQARTGLTIGNPELDPDFRLTATPANLVCCIDKVTAVGAERLPSHDIHHTLRPQGNAWDIGAAELRP